MNTVLQQRIAWALLAAILLVGAWLQLSAPGTSPPGLNVDEGINGWNAYCLLKTGMDQHGVHFPLFYMRGFGALDNRTPLFIYFEIPFLALRGYTIEGMRMAGGVAGILALLTMFYVGGRLFGKATGLTAAAMLAVCPWAVQTTRWGHEAASSVLEITGTLAIVIWAGFPLESPTGSEGRPQLWRALLAGLVCGLCCYGYQSTRIFLPVFLAGTVLSNWRAWLKCDKRSLAALVLGFTLLFGPLAWKHLTDPNISGRGSKMWIWDASDSIPVKIGKALTRYPAHFGPSFLFTEGDAFPWYTPPSGYGQFLLYMAPLFLAGAGFVISRWRSSPPARLLAVWVLLYPIGDLMSKHPSSHALRSMAGLPALVLLAAWGAVEVVRAVQRTNRIAGWVLAGLMLCASGAMTVGFFRDFFGDFNRDMRFFHGYGPDLVQALQWLRPKLSEVDVVYCTSIDLPHPYVFFLLETGYQPEDWFRDPKEMTVGPTPNGHHPGEEVYTRVGKFHFMFGNSIVGELKALQDNGKPDHLVFIFRPGESPFPSSLRPTAIFLDPAGKPALEVYALDL